MSEITAQNVGMVLCSGYDLESSYRSKELAEKYPSVYFCCGFQPQELLKYKEGDIEKLRLLSRHEKCLAIGEIGLDYHWADNPPVQLQKELLLKQMQLAYEEGLPIVVHSRDCAEDMLSFMQEHRELLKYGADLHCYSHSAEMSEAFFALGFYFSFGGTSTYTGSKKVQKSVSRVPMDRLLTETDSPYLTPEPYRGSINTPKYIPVIAQRLAEIKGVSVETLQTAVYENAKRLFKKWQ